MSEGVEPIRTPHWTQPHPLGCVPQPCGCQPKRHPDLGPEDSYHLGFATCPLCHVAVPLVGDHICRGKIVTATALATFVAPSGIEVVDE